MIVTVNRQEIFNFSLKKFGIGYSKNAKTNAKNIGPNMLVNLATKKVNSATNTSATTNLVVLLQEGDFSIFFECIFSCL